MFELPKLNFLYNALEPYIDTQTIEIHYLKHHTAYVNNLNKALEGYPELQEKTVEELLTSLDSIPKEIKGPIRNNAGGHLNHTVFWSILAPSAGGEPTGELAKKIDVNFGSFSVFKEEFNKAGLARFGSGWVWLVKDQADKLSIISTANQDNPISGGGKVIFGVDVWEHAYYLKYQNRRTDYLNAVWNVLNWDAIQTSIQA